MKEYSSHSSQTSHRVICLRLTSSTQMAGGREKGMMDAVCMEVRKATRTCRRRFLDEGSCQRFLVSAWLTSPCRSGEAHVFERSQSAPQDASSHRVVRPQRRCGMMFRKCLLERFQLPREFYFAAGCRCGEKTVACVYGIVKVNLEERFEVSRANMSSILRVISLFRATCGTWLMGQSELVTFLSVLRFTTFHSTESLQPHSPDHIKAHTCNFQRVELSSGWSRCFPFVVGTLFYHSVSLQYLAQVTLRMT